MLKKENKIKKTFENYEKVNQKVKIVPAQNRYLYLTSKFSFCFLLMDLQGDYHDGWWFVWCTKFW